MVVVDTSAWIEWLIGGSVQKALTKGFPKKAQCVVPTVVQLELAMWLSREVDEDRADHVIAYTQECIVASLDTRLALLAAELHREHKLSTADSIVYATALEFDADLLTCDAHFEKLPRVILVRKGA